MTFKELQEFVYAGLEVVMPPWTMQLQVKRRLIEAHMRVVAERHLNHETATLNFVADDPEVSLPADFLRIKSLLRGDVQMRQVDDVTYERLTANLELIDYTGYEPEVFALFEPNRIRVFPPPSATEAAAATLTYEAKVAEMSADSDEPAGLPAPWHELLGHMVVASLGTIEQKNYAIQQVRDLRVSLDRNMSDRGGDQIQVQLQGYPPRS